MSTSRPPDFPGQELLDELSKLSDRGLLKDSVSKAEHFTKEDEESADRRHRSDVSRHINRVKIAVMWLAFVFVAFLVGLLSWMLAKQVEGVIHTDASRSGALSWLWSTLLTVGATLFVERHVLQKRRR